MSIYTKIARIGQGSYGVVYKAQNQQNKEIVAIKRIKLETREEGIPASAIREIALLKELRHPNIVKLYDVVHTQHRLALIFEFCDWDLRRYMQSQANCLSQSQIISFSYQLLSALEFIHKNSIIHRDIKPQNLLLNKKNELKLGDFGLARSTFIPVDQLSTEVITQWYRPPEILLGIKDYSYPVDIWSAGCVIAEMIAGQPLFPCQNNEEQLECVCQMFGYDKLVRAFPQYESEIPHVQAVAGDTSILKQRLGNNCPAGMLDLLEKMLEVDPQTRITAEDALKHTVFANSTQTPVNSA